MIIEGRADLIEGADKRFLAGFMQIRFSPDKVLIEVPKARHLDEAYVSAEFAVEDIIEALIFQGLVERKQQ